MICNDDVNYRWNARAAEEIRYYNAKQETNKQKEEKKDHSTYASPRQIESFMEHLIHLHDTTNILWTYFFANVPHAGRPRFNC